MARNHKFSITLAELVRGGKSILDAAVKYAQPLAARLQVSRVTQLQGLLDTVNTASTGQKTAVGEVGTLTLQQNAALKEVERLMSEARNFAKRAFPGQTVKLHEQFQVGMAKNKAHEHNDLAVITQRARIILANCVEPTNAAALAGKGWLAADSTALDTAITALCTVDETQESGKGVSKGETEMVTQAANDLYDGLLDIQLIAGKVFPAGNPVNTPIRGEFRIGTFPGVTHSKPGTPPVTPLTAAGFGDAHANGALTRIADNAGKPAYQAAGGWWYCWNPDGGMWICRDAAPGTGDNSNNRYADLQYAADLTAVQWTPGFNPGPLPCGTVS